MRSVKYSVSRLREPEGDKTHQVIYETISKNEGTGGFGYGSKFRGSYKQCIERKKELENVSKRRSTRISNKKQNNK